MALLAGLAGLFLLLPQRVLSGPYLSSTHASSAAGVSRTDIVSRGLTRGLCAHCHEQHASIDGGEPDPASGAADTYALFATSFVSQTDNFCMKCHTDAGSVQSGGAVVNRSYSYRAGGWTADPVNDIREMFTYASPPSPPAPSAHDLGDIRTFIAMQPWGFTSNSNPCSACHNMHRATGDPASAPNGVKSNATRGWPVSRPSQHNRDNALWGLWGDDAATERMNIYAPGGQYQAPYRFGGLAAGYEPGGSAVQDGSNLTDYVTFCSDCHNAVNTIYSTPLGRNVRAINWATAMHGGGAATNGVGFTDLVPPYQDALIGSYKLSCTDCHEPHGSANNYLVRREVNNGLVSVTQNGAGNYSITDPMQNWEWAHLCERCHDNLRAGTQGAHVHPDTILGDAACSSTRCHPMVWISPPGYFATVYRNCGECHFHGNSTIDGLPYGKQLF